jgi:hypothetical protein
MELRNRPLVRIRLNHTRWRLKRFGLRPLQRESHSISLLARCGQAKKVRVRASRDPTADETLCLACGTSFDLRPFTKKKTLENAICS